LEGDRLVIVVDVTTDIVKNSIRVLFTLDGNSVYFFDVEDSLSLDNIYYVEVMFDFDFDFVYVRGTLPPQQYVKINYFSIERRVSDGI
jgi:hypothetical protein